MFITTHGAVISFAGNDISESRALTAVAELMRGFGVGWGNMMTRKGKLMKYKEISGIFLCNVVHFPFLNKKVN